MTERTTTDFDAVIARLQEQVTRITIQLGFMAAEHAGHEAYLQALGIDMNLPRQELLEQIQKNTESLSGFANGSTTKIFLLISRIAKLAGPACFELLLQLFTLIGMLEEVREQQAQAKADNFEEHFKGIIARLPVPPEKLGPIMPIEETVFGESSSSLPLDNPSPVEVDDE